MISENLPRWYVLYVAYRRELIVASKLNEIGYETCVPTTIELRQWSDRIKKINKVLFPNYVFVELDLKQSNQITGIQHVIKFVKFGSEYAVLKDWEIQLIKNLGKIPHPVTIHLGDISNGDEVEIILGPLKNMRGQVNWKNQTGTLAISIPALHCFAQVIVNHNEVRKI